MNAGQMPSVLVVEDESIIALDIQQTLVELGYDAFAIASSAEEAVAHALGRCPDVVLMDIHINGTVDGISAAQLFQELFRVPVIYVTAHADEATIERARMSRPYGYLLKPVRAVELKAAITDTLRAHKLSIPL